MGQYSSKITDWPADERPRERLLQHGPDVLSEAELLAIILRTGSGDDTSVDLARHLLDHYGGFRGIDSQTVTDLCKIKGIGLAKACQIKAALEIAKRLVQQHWRVQERIQCSEDAYRFIHLRVQDLGREVFRVIFLTNRHTVIGEKTVFEGSLTESVVSPREIILFALQQSAASLILVHNHPSGDPSPSDEDKRVTMKMIQACQYFDLNVLDHIVVGRDSFFSFADQGLLTQS